MTSDDLAMDLEALTDEACAHETYRLADEEIAMIIRLQMSRLKGEDVPPVPKGTPARRSWAITADGFARTLANLTWKAIDPKRGSMPVADVVEALAEEMRRMCIETEA
jgi:hypothetical protein